MGVVRGSIPRESIFPFLSLVFFFFSLYIACLFSDSSVQYKVNTKTLEYSSPSYALTPRQISLPEINVLTTIPTPTTSLPTPVHPRSAPGINKSHASTTIRFIAVDDHRLVRIELDLELPLDLELALFAPPLPIPVTPENSTQALPRTDRESP